MEPVRSDFLRVMMERGYFNQCTDTATLDERLSKGPVTAYVGFDATADSLHIGHLLPIMMLRWFQKTGNRPIALLGGGTTKVGDPSGRDETRRLLDDAAIAANAASIKRTFDRFLDFSAGPNGALMENNAAWLDELRYIPFLRDVGRHFTINRMLTFDSVRMRLEREQPLTFLEFNYMILQAYDFVELNRRYGCALQMGGSDQWGNIVNGIDLGRRIAEAELFGLTCPLITTSSGQKMGKSMGGAIWLNADRFAPYDYYQFWRNTEDADVGRFLKLFTELPLDEIARLASLQGAEINEAKKVLAFEATALLHGQEAAEESAETARRTFEEGALAAGLPTFDLPRSQLADGVEIVELFRLSGLAASKGEARRLIQQGGARLNDAPVADDTRKADLSDLTGEGVLKLSAGKKRHALVRAV